MLVLVGRSGLDNIWFWAMKFSAVEWAGKQQYSTPSLTHSLITRLVHFILYTTNKELYCTAVTPIPRVYCVGFVVLEEFLECGGLCGLVSE